MTDKRQVDHQSNTNFIREIVEQDLVEGKYKQIVTRFPPEPNGYLHIGHAKSIVLNFGIAEDYSGRCHLRFDDTNPETESEEYIRSIKDVVSWLGYDWQDRLYFASDYFEQFYTYALKLIRTGNAYIDSMTEEEIRNYRGSVKSPGKPSPYRDRTPQENIDLFQQMRAGEFPDGSHVLRAKIDMESPHMIMRDPLLYRIRHARHYRQGDEWCIYPMYDFAHPLEDAIEEITHSLCTLEFDTNRVLYDWVLERCLEPEDLAGRPHQYEFARLNLSFTVMSKRKLLRLVREKLVDGWDDPRLPTLAGLRRRGVPPNAIRRFCEELGVTRTESVVEMGHFEHVLRDELNYEAPRINAVVDPLKVVITNYPEGKTDWLEAPYWPREIDKQDSRDIPFTRSLYIEREDFREEPPQGFHRLAPGREVRLRYGYFITCEDIVKDSDGKIVELHCRYDPDTRGGDAPDGRSPAGTLHWVSADHALSAEIRSYNRLFRIPNPQAGQKAFTDELNPDSLIISKGYVESSIQSYPQDQRYQFERIGYFWQDQENSGDDSLVFTQIVPLRDTWTGEAETPDRTDIQKKRQEKEREKARQRRRSSQRDGDVASELTADQNARFQQYIDEFGLPREDAAIIAREEDLVEFFDAALDTYAAPETIANWIVNRLMAIRKETPLAALPFGPEEFARLVELVEKDIVSTKAADRVLEQMTLSGGSPDHIVERDGLRQMDDLEHLKSIILELIENSPEEVAKYRDGNHKLIGYFMGQIMRRTKGTVNPELTRQLLRELLSA